MTDYKNLAKAFIDGIEIQNIPKIRATLYLDGHLFATGQAEVANDGVTFYPEHEKHLDNVLHGSISLKVKETEPAIPLLHPIELFEIGSEKIWFFAYPPA